MLVVEEAGRGERKCQRREKKRYKLEWLFYPSPSADTEAYILTSLQGTFFFIQVFLNKYMYTDQPK